MGVSLLRAGKVPLRLSLTSPSHTMAVLSLPLSFSNSFWTHDYRNGLELLYNKLEQVRVPATCGCYIQT